MMCVNEAQTNEFKRDVDKILNRSYRLKTYSYNQQLAHIKNLNENQKLVNSLKLLKQENRISYLNLNKIKNDIENRMRFIQLSTGNMFTKETPLPKSSTKSVKSRQKIDAMNVKRNTNDSSLSFSTESSDSDGSLDDNKSDVDTIDTPRLASPSGQEKKLDPKVQLDRPKSLYCPRPKSVRIVERKTQSAMPNVGAVKQSFEFQIDESTAALSNVWRNMPQDAHDRVEYLKKKDPVFAKRHKQLLVAKLLNRAPEFDYNDNLSNACTGTAFNFKRYQRELIENVGNRKNDQNKVYQNEMIRVDQKVKEFIRDFKIF